MNQANSVCCVWLYDKGLGVYIERALQRFHIVELEVGRIGSHIIDLSHSVRLEVNLTFSANHTFLQESLVHLCQSCIIVALSLIRRVPCIVFLVSPVRIGATYVFIEIKGSIQEIGLAPR